MPNRGGGCPYLPSGITYNFTSTPYTLNYAGRVFEKDLAPLSNATISAMMRCCEGPVHWNEEVSMIVEGQPWSEENEVMQCALWCELDQSGGLRRTSGDGLRWMECVEGLVDVEIEFRIEGRPDSMAMTIRRPNMAGVAVLSLFVATAMPLFG